MCNAIRHLLFSLCLWCALPLSAQDYKERIRSDYSSQIQTSTTLYGMGLANVYDTYLSPQEYTGADLKLTKENLKTSTLSQDGRLKRQSYLSIDFSYTNNKAENNHTMSALASWSYGYLYQIPISSKLSLLAGGLGNISGGYTYNLRNGNNPASLRTSLSADASAMVLYNLKAGHSNISLRYQIFVPVLGVMFSPHYGESYYEIFCEGGGSGTVKFTTPLSRPSTYHILSADIPLRKFTLRCAYVMDLQQSKLNGIRTHHYAHTLMFGVVKNFLRL